MDIFLEISLITILLTLFAFLMRLFRQPFIVGYIITGIISGPFALNILRSQDSIELFSKLGITILLYIVGLNLNPKVLQEVGLTSFKTGLAQIFLTTIVGLFICTLMGFQLLPSLYIAIALTFSSTIIILKLLSDQGDLHSLYGKISIGLLLVQDLAASVLLIGLTVSLPPPLLLFKGLILAILIYVLSKFIIPKLLPKIAENQELLFIFSISYGLTLASIFSKSGFSPEIGALLAGVSLSTSTFAAEIGSRLKPLRDFFIPLFFLLLGSQINLNTLPYIVTPAIILSLYVLAGNPLIVFMLLNLQGFKNKTAFKTGLTMAQISEFSLVLGSLGLSLGHISSQHFSLITLVGLITITGSTYLIKYSDTIYKNLEPLLKLLQFRKLYRENPETLETLPDIILFGYDRSGLDFARSIQHLNLPYLIIDYNPESIQRLLAQNLPHKYGDAEDIEFLDEIGFKSAKLIISTIPNPDVNKFLVAHFKKFNPRGLSIVISHQVKDTLELYALGASYVIVPIYFGSRYLSHLFSRHGLDPEIIKAERARHLLDLTTKNTL